jgi:hypothetical protein
MDMAIDVEDIYWIQGDATLLRVKKTGVGGPTMVHEAPGLYLRGLATDADGVYWFTSDGKLHAQRLR